MGDRAGLSLAAALDGIAARVPDRPALVWRGRTWTWGEEADRTARLATVLADHDVGLADAPATEGWESPHDHVALYLLNGNEYLEGMVGAARARAAAFNVNWRYTAEEVAGILADASTAAVIYHGRFAPVLAEAVALMPTPPRLLLRADDGTERLAAAGRPRPGGGPRRGRTGTGGPGLVGRRPLHPLHRGHDRAVPRACCGARPTSPRPAWASPPTSTRWWSGPRATRCCGPSRRRRSCTARRTGTP